MKKTLYCVLIIAGLLATSVVLAQDNKASEQPKGQPKQIQSATPATPVAPAAKPAVQPGAQQQGAKEAMAANVARMQEQHKAAIDELQAVKQLAIEEKATKTAAAVDTLIAKRNAQFEQQMQMMQRQMKMFEDMGATKPGATVQPPTRPAIDAAKAPAVQPKQDAPKAAPTTESKKNAEK